MFKWVAAAAPASRCRVYGEAPLMTKFVYHMGSLQVGANARFRASP